MERTREKAAGSTRRSRISQQQAADALVLQRTSITQIEAGNRAVSTLELTRLADMYRRPVTWFLSEQSPESEDPWSSCIVRRSGSKTPRSRSVRWTVASRMREGSASKVCSAMSETRPPTYSEPVPQSPWDAISQGSVLLRRSAGVSISAPERSRARQLDRRTGIWASVRSAGEDVGLFMHHSSIAWSSS